MSMHIHEACEAKLKAQARSLLSAFKEVIRSGVEGVGRDRLDRSDILMIALAAEQLLYEALANFPEEDREDWIQGIIANLPNNVAEVRHEIEVHPADCPHCARRQAERENVQ
jgi:hypothetical protein